MLHKVLKKAYSLNIEAELYYTQIEKTTASFENSKFKSVEEKTVEGVGVRVKKNRKIGFAFTNILNEKNLANILGKALKVAAITGENDYADFSSEKIEDKSYLSSKIRDYPKEEIVEECNRILNLTLNKIKKYDLKPLVTGGVSKIVKKIRILNTNNVDQSYDKSILTKSVYGKTSKVNSLEVETVDFNTLDFGKDPDELTDLFTEKLINSLNPNDRKEIKGPLVFHPKALGEILFYTIGQASSGESIVRQKSFLSGKVNSEIASENVTILDDGKDKQNITGRPFDGEGTPTRVNTLISKGIFETPVYDIEWGNRAGEKTTGNAHRSYNTTPKINLNSITITPTVKKTELVDEVKDGLYVESVTGAHTSNNVTGDFGVVVIGGYKIKSGHLTEPIYGPVLSTSCIHLLKSIKEIASKKEDYVFNGTTISFGQSLIEFE